MKIKKIRLYNKYKRFYDLTIDLGDNPKKVIALVGPNGCGKSSVFDGMLMVANRFQAVGIYGGKNQDFHSMTGSFVEASVEIEFDSYSDYSKAWHGKAEAGKRNTIFSFRNAYRYSSQLNVTSMEAQPPIENNNIGASSSVDLDSKMESNYQRLYVHITNYFKEHDCRLSEAKSQILSKINKILSECLEIEIYDYGDIMDQRGTLYFKKKDQSEPYTFNVLSAGEKEVVDILLDIYLKRDTYNDTIYIIDEPELHLNTGIQKKLLIALEKLIPDSCQLWVATHSLGFLNALQNDLRDKASIIHFKGKLATEVAELSPIQGTRREWQEIFKTALEDLTGLISPKIIIYCEGKVSPALNGEDQGLDAAIYNQIFEKDYPHVLFISSGGQTQPDKNASIALAVLNKAFIDAQILLLKDKDINSDKTDTTDQQRDEFIGRNPTTNRMLTRKEVEDYIFDFEVISAAYPSVQKADYDTIIIRDGDIKSKGGELMTLCGIHTGMTQNEFKIHLASNINCAMQVYQELVGVIGLNEERQLRVATTQ